MIHRFCIAGLFLSCFIVKPVLAQNVEPFEQPLFHLKLPWKVLQPQQWKLSKGDQMQALKDGSALFNMPGAASAYSHLHFHPGKQMITHVRFEALTDSSLPNNGPGRAKDGQFRIFAFEVHVYAKNAQRQKKLIEIKKGVTNQASEDEPLDNTWDFLSDTGWLAPERNTPHTPVTAVFVLEKPIQCTMNTGLMIRWEAGNRDYRTPGRVRISIADATKPKKGKVRPKKQTAK